MVVRGKLPHLLFPYSYFFLDQRHSVYTYNHPPIYLSVFRNTQMYFLVSGKITSSSKYSFQKHKFPFNIVVGDEKRLWCLRCWRRWKRQAAIRVTGLKGRLRAGHRARWLSEDMSLFSCIPHMDGTVRAKAIYAPMLLKCPVRWQRVQGQRGEKKRHRIFCLSWIMSKWPSWMKSRWVT